MNEFIHINAQLFYIILLIIGDIGILCFLFVLICNIVDYFTPINDGINNKQNENFIIRLLSKLHNTKCFNQDKNDDIN